MTGGTDDNRPVLVAALGAAPSEQSSEPTPGLRYRVALDPRLIAKGQDRLEVAANGVALAFVRAADPRARCVVPDQDADLGFQRRGAVGREADQVALDPEPAPAASGLDADQLAADHVAGARLGVADNRVRAAGEHEDALLALRHGRPPTRHSRVSLAGRLARARGPPRVEDRLLARRRRSRKRRGGRRSLDGMSADVRLDPPGRSANHSARTGAVGAAPSPAQPMRTRL